VAEQHGVQSEDKAKLNRRTHAEPDDAAPDLDAGEASHPLLRLQATIGNAGIARMLAQRSAQDDPEKIGVEGGEVGPDTAARIQAMRGSGSPLDTATRASMEASFGTSFRDVRVHADHQADTLNRRLTARAFTTGSDIFLRSDANAGDSRLIAHELSHVVQQRSMSGGGGMRVGAADDRHEQAAHGIADAVATAAPPVAQAQRQADDEELQASHDVAQRQADDEELQASHDFAQRQADEEELQASHDVAQRQTEDEELST